jgi:hypothetical protein
MGAQVLQQLLAILTILLATAIARSYSHSTISNGFFANCRMAVPELTA